jgi:hypothetical protein
MREAIPAVELQSTVLLLPGSRFAGTGRWHESHGADPHTARIARRGVSRHPRPRTRLPTPLVQRTGPDRGSRRGTSARPASPGARCPCVGKSAAAARGRHVRRLSPAPVEGPGWVGGGMCRSAARRRRPALWCGRRFAGARGCRAVASRGSRRPPARRTGRCPRRCACIASQFINDSSLVRPARWCAGSPGGTLRRRTS